MTWNKQKDEIVWEGVETGIGPSPLKGTANIQNANISTDSGEVMASFGRLAQQQTLLIAQTLTASVGAGTTLLDAPASLQAGQWIHTSTSTIGAATTTASYLVVAGGGGGGGATASNASGGGGAGGMLTGTFSAAVTSYAITIGAGGAGGTTGNNGTSGSSSIIATVATASGGGGGGKPGTAGTNGASGGGGASNSGGGSSAGGTGIVGQGKAGGTGFDSATSGNRSGGGGGGATALGSNGASGIGGAGGAGTSSSISGAAVTYAGGGGGGGTAPASGGSGGGGRGGSSGDAIAPIDGQAGLGGGGGGNYGAFSGANGGSGVVIISYPTGSMTATGGSITFSGGNTIHTFYSSDTFTVQSIVANTNYFVSYKDTNNRVKLSAVYDPYCLYPIVHDTSGTAEFLTALLPTAAIAKATETYNGTDYRYYILDTSSQVWVYDTAVYTASLASSGVGTTWMLPDPTFDFTQAYAGMAVLNGWLFVLRDRYIRGKPTSTLGTPFATLTNGYLVNQSGRNRFAYVGHQGKMYFCCNNYIGSMFPNTSLLTGAANVQSFCSYTWSGSTGTVSSVISGSLPYTTDSSGGVIRIPAVFFPDNGGSLPAGLTAATIYYIQVNITAGTFQIYTALTGGTALTISAAGTQYFNTFYPTGADAGIYGSHSTVTFSNQRVNLPANEIAQCMVEIGNTILIGGISNTLYPWNQVDVTPSDLIALPESNVKSMVNVNNMAYVFAGNKGNIYISNNSIASLALKVPDYCAGVPGTPSSYIEPVFTWGDSMYVRGRVYFSILDQTATKSGNCGGVWSFVPSQNLYIGEDTGTALRLENQNSYGSYNGYASILIPAQTQTVISPQYWAAWQDSYSTATSNFGIDGTNTVPATTYIVETDLLETGTLLKKQTDSQIEYKLTTPLATGDSVQLYYRVNATDAWTSCGSVVQETTNPISGYFEVNFQNTQWVQFRAVCTTTGNATSSFTRLRRIWFR